MNKQQRSERKQIRLQQVRAILATRRNWKSREIAESLGLSAPLVNMYLNELQVAGEAFIVGTERHPSRGGTAFIWSGKRKPWYRRVIDWLTGDSDLKVPA